MIDLEDVPVIGKLVGVGAALLHALGSAPDLVAGVFAFAFTNFEAVLPVVSTLTSLAGRVPWLPSLIQEFGRPLVTLGLIVVFVSKLYDFVKHFAEKHSDS